MKKKGVAERCGNASQSKHSICPADKLVLHLLRTPYIRLCCVNRNADSTRRNSRVTSLCCSDKNTSTHASAVAQSRDMNIPAAYHCICALCNKLRAPRTSQDVVAARTRSVSNSWRDDIDSQSFGFLSPGACFNSHSANQHSFVVLFIQPHSTAYNCSRLIAALAMTSHICMATPPRNPHRYWINAPVKEKEKGAVSM